jgi:hypothetical protein
MKLIAAILLYIASVSFVGCGGEEAPETGTTSSEATFSPLVGPWYSATAPGNEVRADVLYVPDGKFAMFIAPVGLSLDTLFAIGGPIDPDSYHFGTDVIVNGEKRQCYGFASSDGQRMFFGLRAIGDPTTYSDSWTFLRTVSP